MLVIGRSSWVVPIQGEDVNAEAGTKLAEETTEKSSVTGVTADEEAITRSEAIAQTETTGLEAITEFTDKSEAETNWMAYLAGTWGLCITGGGFEKVKRNS